jgi:hypothetical protein
LAHAQEALPAAKATGNADLSVRALLAIAGLTGDRDEISGVSAGEAVQHARRAVEFARRPGVTPGMS